MFLSDKSGFLHRSIPTKAMNTIMKDRIGISCVPNETVVQTPLQHERVVCSWREAQFASLIPPVTCHRRNAVTLELPVDVEFWKQKWKV